MTEPVLPIGTELTTDEEWRFVPDFAEGYAVSNHGRVISYRRRMPAFMTWHVNHLRGNYASIPLAHPETRKHSRHRIHALVMEAFIGPRPEGMDIRHLDGNPLNNYLSNLAYGTRTENMQDALAHGTHNNASKTICKRGHDLSGENVRIDLKGRRFCRTCTAERNFANRAKAAEAARDRRAANREEYNRLARERRYAKQASLAPQLNS